MLSTLKIIGSVVPLIMIIGSLVGLLNEVKKSFQVTRSRRGLSKQISQIERAGQEMETNVNKRIGMVCGTYIILQLPGFLVLTMDQMPPSKKDGLHIATIILAFCTTFINFLLEEN